MGSDIDRAEADTTALDLILEATRALLWVSTAADARILAEGVVHSLGGDVVSANQASHHAVPLDLSFGDGEPVVPEAHTSSARLLMERHLPMFVEDLRRAVDLGTQAARLAEDASIDSVTALPNRRMLERTLSRLLPGDVVIMIDLDHFKLVNDTLGHVAGDDVLHAMGMALRDSLRGRDVVGRYGGEEFVLVLSDGSDPDGFLERFRTTWEKERPQPVTFSAGIATMTNDSMAALKAADAAMYRAKAAGRDQWMTAPEVHDDPVSPLTPETVEDIDDVSRPAFVAFSEIACSDGEQDHLEAAFRDRLGAVERAPGFRSLEVWADVADSSAYSMVSWWDSRELFQQYMKSADHRSSHNRIATGDGRPRAARFRRFRVVAR